MSAACEHEHLTLGLAGPALAAALTAAETRCSGLDQRMTAPRRRALQMLLQSGHPLKAYDLIADFGADGAPAKPPTVYRALDFLERFGFAHRIQSLNAFVPCRRGLPGHAAAFLICDCCGATQEVESAVAAPVEAVAAQSGYVVHSVTVEVHGLCGACR